MRSAVKLAPWACIPALGLLLVTGCGSTSTGGDDSGDEKDHEGCKYTTGKSRQHFEETPIPAGFFDFDGRSCAPFTGTVSYMGQALDESAFGPADTIVDRDGDPISLSDPVGTTGTVGIEIVGLSLVSTEPITVVCDGEPTGWNVSVDLSETAAPKGTLTAVKSHANGGTATSTLFLHPRLTFTYVDDPSVVRVFDTAFEGFAPTQFDATFPWAHALDSNDPDRGTNFLPGVDSPPGAPRQRLPEVADSPTPPGAHSKCTQHVSRGGDYVHETCPAAPAKAAPP